MITALKKKWICMKSSKGDIFSLDFKSANLEDIPSIVFVHERTLDSLCLNSNNIRLLPRELFLCSRLKRLYIADNDITFIPPLIKTLPLLSHLDMSKNYITEIPECIKFCPNLSVLNLSANPIERFPGDLSSMVCLSELYLNGTGVDCIPNMTGLINLKVLELRDNKLQSLPKSFCGLVCLQKLDLGNNKFTNWPLPLHSLTELEELSINNNRLAVVSKEIGKLTSLCYLDLSENQISSIHEDIGNCVSLNDVFLNNNRINELPQSIGKLKKLKKLRIENNCLIKLPPTIGNLSQMYELNVGCNNLETLPKEISSLKNLRVLWLDDNFLTSLPNELCNCSNLHVISVRSNNLEALPESLGKLIHLSVFNMVDNKISYLPNSVQMLKELKAFWIVDNQIIPMIHFYPTTTRSGLKMMTCSLLPQQHHDNHDGAERNGTKRHSDRFVSFDSTAVQNPRRMSYPKEMKNSFKYSMHIPVQKDLEDDRLHDNSIVDEEFYDYDDILANDSFNHNSSNSNLNAHGDLDVSAEGRHHPQNPPHNPETRDPFAPTRRGILRLDENAGSLDTPEEEIDVDQPLPSETSSGDDSVSSTMSYKDFLRSLSKYDIHLPKKKRKPHNNNNHNNNPSRGLRRQQHSDVLYRQSHHDLQETIGLEERKVLRERNIASRQARSTYFEDDSIYFADRRSRTQSSFLH